MEKQNSKSLKQSNRNTKHTNTSKRSNSSTKNMASSNRLNSTVKSTDVLNHGNNSAKNTVSLNRGNSSAINKTSLNQSNSNISKRNSRTSTSTSSTRTYTSENKGSLYTATSIKRHNEKSSQNWGLLFTKLIIQAVLCILFYFVVYIIVIDYAGEAYDFAYQIFGDVCVEPSSDKKVKVTIPENATLKEVASLLADKNLIKNEYSFYIRGKLSTNNTRVILPGTYVLYPSDNYEDILNTLTQSDNVE